MKSRKIHVESDRSIDTRLRNELMDGSQTPRFAGFDFDGNYVPFLGNHEVDFGIGRPSLSKPVVYFWILQALMAIGEVLGHELLAYISPIDQQCIAFSQIFPLGAR